MENLHLLFNKDFYGKLSVDRDMSFQISDIVKKSERLYSATFLKTDYRKNKLGNTSFLMKTSYPGMLIGSGNIHGVSVEDDAKIGFTFDYVTGQPYIPATSVKGVIKTYFSNPEVFRKLSGFADADGETIKSFVREIFEESSEGNAKDIFFDAVIKHGDKDGFVVGKDFITPHPDSVKNPVPLQFVKVLPNVVFEFSFKLTDTTVCEITLDKQKKKDMFIRILETFGIGAKTNVGYGQLKYVKEDENYSYPTPDTAARRFASINNTSTNNRINENNERQQQRQNNTRRDSTRASRKVINPESISVNESKQDNSRVKAGAYVWCKVTGKADFGFFADIISTKKRGRIYSSEIPSSSAKPWESYVSVGDKVLVRIQKIQGYKISFSFFETDK